jgi:hypothetical protein
MRIKKILYLPCRADLSAIARGDGGLGAYGSPARIKPNQPIRAKIQTQYRPMPAKKLSPSCLALDSVSRLSAQSKLENSR